MHVTILVSLHRFLKYLAVKFINKVNVIVRTTRLFVQYITKFLSLSSAL